MMGVYESTEGYGKKGLLLILFGREFDSRRLHHSRLLIIMRE